MQQGLRFDSRDQMIRTIMANCQKELVTARNLTPEIAQMFVKRVLGYMHPTAFIVTPVHFDYGKNTSIGANSFVNVNCTFLDVGKIVIGDNVLIGPNVNFSAVIHDNDPEVRRSNPFMITPKPIVVKDNALIYSNVTIIGGVVIGENAIVAAGSVVTSNVPDNAFVAGSPAKIIELKSKINE